MILGLVIPMLEFCLRSFSLSLSLCLCAPSPFSLLL